jgi:hypothetical protein
MVLNKTKLKSNKLALGNVNFDLILYWNIEIILWFLVVFFTLYTLFLHQNLVKIPHNHYLKLSIRKYLW